MRATALALLVAVSMAAPAQSQNIISNDAPSFYTDIWSILQPTVLVLASTIFPILATMIAYKITALLGVKDENSRRDLEEKIRDALHQSAANGARVALVRAGLPAFPSMDQIRDKLPEIRRIGIEYMREKNPSDIKTAKLDDRGLDDILMSKLPELAGSLSIASVGEIAPALPPPTQAPPAPPAPPAQVA